MQIIEAITQSAHLYQTPDNQMGFGIPNYSLANALLLNVEDIDEVIPLTFILIQYLLMLGLTYNRHTDISYRLVDVGGREILQGKRLVLCLDFYEIPALPSGIYILEATTEDKVFVERLNVVN